MNVWVQWYKQARVPDTWYGRVPKDAREASGMKGRPGQRGEGEKQRRVKNKGKAKGGRILQAVVSKAVVVSIV